MPAILRVVYSYPQDLSDDALEKNTKKTLFAF